MAVCGIELFVDGAWVRAGEVHVRDERVGYGGPGRFEYDLDYLEQRQADLGAIDARAVSCLRPLAYEVRDEARWPSFLLDIIPSGAARRFWERELGVPNTSSSDWAVLVRGAGNPPGNVRIADATAREKSEHPGFTRAEVVLRAERFLEYARERGAEIAGASGAGGDSPKLLLREDHGGRFHADGALDDARARTSWLVKFPRSRAEMDRLVLHAEAAYHRVARRFGARVHETLEWEDGCLFVPRFDRPARDGRIERLGLESLCSLCGVTDFGTPIPKETQAAAVARFSSDPARDLRELVLRDVLDVALGNTDNHARNTAVLKDARGRIELSPLYDFAPMFLDTGGIARVCRWQDETGAYPRWAGVARALEPHGLEPKATLAWLRSLAPSVRSLPAWLAEEGAPERVRVEVQPRVERVARDLEEVS